MRKLKVAILLGSAREASNTRKASELVARRLLDLGASVHLVDPRTLDLGIPGKNQSASVAMQMQTEVSTCDGAILITPEYDGSYSAAIKLIIEHLGYPSVLAEKPVALLGVASGGIGAVKALEHLRSVCGSIGAIVLPMSQSIAKVHQQFDEHGRCLDGAIAASIVSTADDLVSFLQAIK